MDEAASMFDRAAAFPDIRSGALYMKSILQLTSGDLQGCMETSASCLDYEPTFSKSVIIWAKAALQIHLDPEPKLELMKRMIARLDAVNEPYGGEGRVEKWLYFFSFDIFFFSFIFDWTLFQRALCSFSPQWHVWQCFAKLQECNH